LYGNKSSADILEERQFEERLKEGERLFNF